MALIPLPNGAIVSLATTIGASKAVSDVSNANPGVFSSAAHGMATGAIALISSEGWSKLDNTVQRIEAGADADTFTVPGLNTSNLSRFPAGGGKGSAKPLTGWTRLPKIPTFGMSGGDAKDKTSSYIDYEKDFMMFIGSNPEKLDFTISYNPDSPAFAALQEAHDSGELQVVSLTLKDGSTLYYPGQVFFNKSPVVAKDEEMVCNVSLALQGEITRFAKLVP